MQRPPAAVPGSDGVKAAVRQAGELSHELRLRPEIAALPHQRLRLGHLVRPGDWYEGDQRGVVEAAGWGRRCWHAELKLHMLLIQQPPDLQVCLAETQLQVGLQHTGSWAQGNT